MSIIAKRPEGDRNFEPAPEGTYQAVCVDVVDLGLVASEFQGEKSVKHKVRIAFQLAEERTDGKRFLVSSFFNLSLHEKASLRLFLEAWRGRRFTESEVIDGFDLEKIIGANAQVQVVHREYKGNTFSNINAILPWPAKFGEAITPVDYVRMIDREPKAEDGAHQMEHQEPQKAKAAVVDSFDDDEIPF